MNDTFLLALAMIPALVIAIVCHEVAHGWAALMLGDPTAKERRRLTLNPIRHVDPVGTLLVPGGLALAGMPVFGWAKPVPVDYRRLRDPRTGMMLVAAAGPLTNLVLAALGAVVLGLTARFASGPLDGALGYFVVTAQLFILINIFLALFNLLPIPPFDGSHILEGLLPRRAAMVYDRLRPLGFPLVFVLLVAVPYLFPGSGIVENVVAPPVDWLEGNYMRLAAFVAGA
ncbi:site-2 protease family protein [Croceibacterium sp. TMG7-5b_MA50]|uniref:site-2 protease family protein n=1 Tax=Croceibacterium sp. TMG7-5b_MA50 TaxID=3121290 RepID=UPI003221D441